MVYIKVGKVLNSQFMYDSSNYELCLNDYNDDTIGEIVDFCYEFMDTDKKIKITIEEVEE